MKYLKRYFLLVVTMLAPLCAGAVSKNEFEQPVTLRISETDEDAEYELDEETYKQLEELYKTGRMKRKLAKKLCSIGLVAMGVSATFSVASVPWMSQMIFDNAAAITFGVGGPFVIAMPFFGAALWQMLKAREADLEALADEENHLKI